MKEPPVSPRGPPGWTSGGPGRSVSTGNQTQPAPGLKSGGSDTIPGAIPVSLLALAAWMVHGFHHLTEALGHSWLYALFESRSTVEAHVAVELLIGVGLVLGVVLAVRARRRR